MSEASRQAILSVVRSFLQVGGSTMAAHGYFSDATAAEIVGAIVSIIGIIWGIVDKYQSERKTAAREVIAVNAGVAISNSTPTILPPVHPADVPAVIEEFKPK